MENTISKVDLIKTQVKEITQYHKPALNLFNAPDDMFYPKMLFKWNDELHASLFKKEVTSSQFYTEFVNDDYSPREKERTLYVFRGSAECINEYFEKKENGRYGEYSRYFVPLQDFEKVDLTKLSKPNPTLTIPFELEEYYKTEDELEDALMSKLTIRDHAAIQWKLPVSQKKWLNKLIQEINKK